MNKLLKKLGAIALVCVLAFSLAACGGGDSGSGDKDASNGQLSEADYKAKVEQIFTDISTISEESMSSIDMTDPNAMDATVKAMTEMVKKVRPLYEELGALNAPDSFKTSQAKIKNGTDASVELLDISLELFELQGNPDQAVAAEKAQELTSKMADFQTKAQDLTTGMSEVMGEV